MIYHWLIIDLPLFKTVDVLRLKIVCLLPSMRSKDNTFRESFFCKGLELWNTEKVDYLLFANLRTVFETYIWILDLFNLYYLKLINLLVDQSKFESNSYKDMEEDKIYHKNIASVPTWYHASLCIFLSFLGVFGILLNGFVIWCFLLRPIVSYDQTLISKTPYSNINWLL